MSEDTNLFNKPKRFLTKVVETVVLTLLGCLVVGFFAFIWDVAIHSKEEFQKLNIEVTALKQIITEEVAQLKVTQETTKENNAIVLKAIKEFQIDNNFDTNQLNSAPLSQQQILDKKDYYRRDIEQKIQSVK